MIRPWTAKDAEFMVYVRNQPELIRWFRQEHKISLEEQLRFMETHPEYKGYIVCNHYDKPVGFVALVLDKAGSAEFSIGILPEEQGKGHAKSAMRDIMDVAKNIYNLRSIYSDVFVDNPALDFYILKCGFSVYELKPNYMKKKGIGMVDAVSIVKIL